MDEKKRLTKKQRVFIDEYLTCFNASEAARRAGYSERTARSQGHRLLTKDDISEAIKERTEEIHMGSIEALKLLSDQARGDIGQIMDISSVGFTLDLKRAEEQGLTKLIKKVKQKTTIYIAKKESGEDREVTELEVELYDSQSAIDKILKLHTTTSIFSSSKKEAVKLHVVYDNKPGVEDDQPKVHVYLPENGREDNL